MDSQSPESIVKRVLGYGYQIHPDALKMLEAQGEEKALEVLDSFTKKYPTAIVIEAEQVEELLQKTPVKTVTELEEDRLTLTGRITQIYDGSGLIQRCPTCNRWIIDNFCMVHSDVEGIWDLRIKARFDDGKERCMLIFKKEVAEKIAGITLEEAKEQGEAATLERIRQALLGKRFAIGGDRLKGGNNFLVKAIRAVK
jgi:ssDNA-binding replication factor A large subunit